MKTDAGDMWRLILSSPSTSYMYRHYSLLYLDWHCIEEQRLTHTHRARRFVFPVSLLTLLHTDSHFCIIFFSRERERESQSCWCQMLICHAAAGGFARLPWGRQKNYLIKTCCYCTITLHFYALCQMLSPICLLGSYFKNRFGIWFMDNNKIYDNLNLFLSLILTVMVWCGFYELFPKTAFYFTVHGPYLA